MGSQRWTYSHGDIVLLAEELQIQVGLLLILQRELEVGHRRVGGRCRWPRAPSRGYTPAVLADEHVGRVEVAVCDLGVRLHVFKADMQFIAVLASRLVAQGRNLRVQLIPESPHLLAGAAMDVALNLDELRHHVSRFSGCSAISCAIVLPSTASMTSAQPSPVFFTSSSAGTFRPDSLRQAWLNASFDDGALGITRLELLGQSCCPRGTTVLVPRSTMISLLIGDSSLRLLAVVCLEIHRFVSLSSFPERRRSARIRHSGRACAGGRTAGRYPSSPAPPPRCSAARGESSSALATPCGRW